MISARPRTAAVLACSALLASACVEQPDRADSPLAPQAAASPTVCASRTNDSPAKLTECVSAEGVTAHLAALQAIADANGGNRATATPGFDASLAYVRGRLEAAGYLVSVQQFTYTEWRERSPSVLEEVAPVPTSLVAGVDFHLLQYSASGDVTAAVTPVDLQLGLGNTSNSGCEAADYAGFPAGNIALVQRGTCSFELKAENAGAAGAVGVVIFNQGNTSEPTRQDPFTGTLGLGYTGGIPVLTVSYSRGAQWAGTPGLVLHLVVDAGNVELAGRNLLAETRAGDPNNVVMVGAHLDGVEAGPGIVDNGSGSAALLETAVQMAKAKPRNRVRLAWWDGHELGLLGSSAYASALTSAELGRIALYLDAHQLAAPNYALFVLDGDGSVSGGAFTGTTGTGAIESLFRGFYTQRGYPSIDRDMLVSVSDWLPFSLAGIPVGGVVTGFSDIKTAAEAAEFGGVAGEAYDPCYHQACDTFANVNSEALDLNSDAVATAVITYAMSTQAVNAIKGKGRNQPPATTTTSALATR